MSARRVIQWAAQIQSISPISTVWKIQNFTGHRGHRRSPLLLSFSYLHLPDISIQIKCTWYVHIGKTVINRRRCQLKGCILENKLAFIIGQSLEWSKSKLNLISSFYNITILLNLIKVPVFGVSIFSTWYLFCSKYFPQMPPSQVFINVYALKKKAVLVGRIIGDGGSLKKRQNFLTSFLKLYYSIGTWRKKIFTIFFMNSFKIYCIFIILV